MDMVSRGWYTFACGSLLLSKPDFRRMIESAYGVTVVRISVSRMPGKTRRVGRKGIPVEQPEWKKIMVLLKPGQTIDAFQIGGPQEETGK